ncbi:MAG TPA: Rnase Y domain-containing protein, partial [Candidatus Polarisedimenticolia bacterium]|nr:Rnase Y domain-containing protein [Candidatus Polarisedimenticolia bacterium]
MTEVLQAVLPAGVIALGGGLLFGWFLKGRAARVEVARTRGQSDEALHRTRREAEDQKRQALLAAREEWLTTKGRLELEIRARSQEVQQSHRALEEREAAHR